MVVWICSLITPKGWDFWRIKKKIKMLWILSISSMIKSLEASNFVFFCALSKEHGIVKMSICFYVMLRWTSYFKGNKTRQSDNTFVVATTFSFFLFYFSSSSLLFLKSLCYLFHLIVNKCKFEYINYKQSKG